MNTKEHDGLFRQLLSINLRIAREPEYVYSVAEWCEKTGISEPDRERPMRLALMGDGGFRLVVREEVMGRGIENG